MIWARVPVRNLLKPTGIRVLCRLTYRWIKSQIEKEAAEKGADAVAKYSHSTIVQTSAPVELGSLRKADGDEGFGN